MRKQFILDGSSLDIKSLVEQSRVDGCDFEVSQSSYEKLSVARKVVDALILSDTPIYGLTTGLGAKVSERLSQEELTRFSYQTLHGRAHSMGEPLAVATVRGAMIVRLNSMLLGASGASPEVFDFIHECLKKNITPVIGRIGSIGVSDLCWGASMGLTFIGEGEMFDSQGTRKSAKIVLEEVGLKPLELKPKDGLVLANHASFSAAMSAIAIFQAESFLDSVQKNTAMTMEALRANLSPLDKFVHEINPQPGFREAAYQINGLLEGSELFSTGTPRKIQDPLSIRNAVQIHGSLLIALKFAKKVVTVEINASSDNPVVDIEQHRMISSGGYYSSHLTLAVETISRALMQTVVAQLARMSKLLSNRHSGLPQFLAHPGADSSGFAPTMKIADALVAEITQLLTPVSHWTSMNADGVEDIQSNAPLAANSLISAIKLSTKLCALEMLMSCQALELGENVKNAPPKLFSSYKLVRKRVPALNQDRPMGNDIEIIAELLTSQSSTC